MILSAPSLPSANAPIKVNTPCQFYSRGLCRAGNSCRFTHVGPSDPVPVPEVKVEPPPEHLLDLCRREMQSWPPLYPRSMVQLTTDIGNIVETVKILQFNTLADGLCGRMPFPHGGFNQLTPDQANWSNRKFRILEEILRFSPDIITLQEVDHYADWFEPKLATVGYKGLYIPKPNSPCQMYDETLSDGCALFYKPGRFQLVKHEMGELKDEKGQQMTHRPSGPCRHVYILAQLQLERCGRKIVVGTSHFKASKSMNGEVCRTMEAAALLRAQDAFTQSDTKCPVFLALDLNGSPVDEKYPSMAYPRFADAGFASAYGLNGRDSEPPFTTWKTRENYYEAKHTIDYIFFKNIAAPLARLSLPDESQIDAQRLPGARYPSDHFAIMAEFGLSYQ